MKKQAKLKLSTETLRNLTGPELQGAAGGFTTTDTVVTYATDCHCTSTTPSNLSNCC